MFDEWILDPMEIKFMGWLSKKIPHPLPSPPLL
jgi:hypothetical protein